MALDLEEYYKFLKNTKKCSDNTLESYQRDLRQFQNYVLEKNVSYLKCDENDILDYLRDLKKIGKSDATRARILASIRGFYTFLMSNKKINNNSILIMQTVKVEKKKVIDNDLKNQENKEKSILNMKFEDSPKGIRDKAILEMTYNTKLKATQLISLKLNDYDAKNQTIQVDNKKIVLIDSICEAISKYLQHSRETLVMYKDVQELFVNTQGSKMTRQGYWKIVKSYEDQYDINNKAETNIKNIVTKNDGIVINKEISDLTTQNNMVSDFILRCMNNGKKED